MIADLDWELLCVGSLERDPAEAAALHQAIARHGLGARVTLAGEWPPERLGEAYQAADIFVLASFLEGYGMAFAEALAHGLPIVATRGGAIPDTVPESAGLLVPPGDAPALAAALRRLLTDAALRRELAAGAASAGATLPSWDDTVRLWGEAFDRLVRDR
jgi:glycosyltransferase involved in cell wall biosynthesis